MQDVNKKRKSTLQSIVKLKWQSWFPFSIFGHTCLIGHKQERKKERKNWMREQTKERMKEQTEERMHECKNERTNRRKIEKERTKDIRHKQTLENEKQHHGE